MGVSLMNPGYRDAPRGSHLPRPFPFVATPGAMDCAAILWQAWDPGRSFSILDRVPLFATPWKTH